MKYTDTDTLKTTMQRHGICVIIPTYNNAGTIERVVHDTLKYCNDVIVVNDGSTDATSDILANISQIDLISYSQNKGKGAALKQGFKYAVKRNFKYAITIDADGQHYPSDIEYFVKAIIEHPGALIVGQRDLTGVDINGKSTFANKFSNFWFALQTGTMLKDTQTGFRAYPLDKLNGLSLLTGRYEAELALLVFAAWSGVEIKSIKINVYYPPRSQRVSHFRPATDFARIFLLNTILCVCTIICGIPLRTYHTLYHRKLFTHEFKCFTQKNGIRKEASITLGRLGRSIFGISFFIIWSVFIFTPTTFIFFAFGKTTEQKKLRFHKLLQHISVFLTKHFPGAKTIYDVPQNENFEAPAIIICNHQSHLDLPVIMALHSKMIFLTKDWVWHNPFYGHIIHKAEYMPISNGIDAIMPQLKDLRDRGYSIVVFPEGTRSENCDVLRFHQGAFHLANELKMDIVPMIIHGAGHYLPKKDFMFRKGIITLRVLNRVNYIPYDPGASFMHIAAHYRKLIRSGYNDIASITEKSQYFKALVLYKYAYRGWAVVNRCKKALANIAYLSTFIDSESPDIKTIRVLNSGIGIFALLYALVNKTVQVYAFEENLKDYVIAKSTGGLPDNLHYIHPVWPNDYMIDGVSFDKTITIRDSKEIIVS